MNEKRSYLRGGMVFIGLFLFIVMMAAPAAAQTWDISAGESIQTAIDNASAGDIVRVQAGTYTEALTVDKALTLEGVGNPEIRQTENVAAVEITTSGSVLRGFTINHTESYCFGVTVTADDVLIENNVLDNCNEGIWLNSVENVVVRKNVIQNCYGWVAMYDNPKGSGNRIYLNDFISNSGGDSSSMGSSNWCSPQEMIYSYESAEHTEYLGNYYGTYTGTDAGNDGVGDTSLGQDNYPLMVPYENYADGQPVLPVADFSVDTTTGAAPLAVRFTDLSTGADEWAWDFDNDGTVDLTEQHPTYTYETEGIYTVSLTVTNAAGSDTETKADYITVSAHQPGTTCPAIEWQHCLGGSSKDDPYATRQTSDGGYIVAGYTRSDDGDVSGNHGLYDLWVVKLNTRGALTWQRCLGGTSLDRAYDVRQTSDGGYVVVGNTKSVDGDVSGNHGGYDAWVVKLNSNGEITWSHCLGGSGIDEACGVRQTADGGYIIAGDTASIDGDVVGKCSGGDSDGWVVKLNSDGAIVWQSCLGGTEDDAVSGIRQIADGYVVAGYTFSNDGDVSANHGRSDVWVVKLNTDGEIVWQSCLGGSDNDYVTKKSSSGIQQTLDGGFIVAGHTCSNDGDVSGIHNVDKTDGWVVKLDCDGALTWQRCLGGSSNYDQLSSVCQTADGEYLVGGYAMSNDGDLSDNHGNKDGWVVKLNGDGDRVWQRCFGGFDYDNVRSVCQTRDEGYLLIMATSSTDGDVSDPLGSTDFWIVKLEGNGTVPPTGLSFAPTPAEIGPGGAAEVSIMLDSLPAGLAGYNLTVTLADASVAEITEVSFPDWASVNASGEMPAGEVWLKAADLNDAVGYGAVDVTLATLTLTGNADGAADISVSVTMMDSDDGCVVSPDCIAGEVHVSALAVMPGCNNPPHDLNGDGIFEDVNGNSLFDFDDIVVFYTDIEWMVENDPAEVFDLNGNGRIDFADLVALFNEL